MTKILDVEKDLSALVSSCSETLENMAFCEVEFKEHSDKYLDGIDFSDKIIVSLKILKPFSAQIFFVAAREFLVEMTSTMYSKLPSDQAADHLLMDVACEMLNIISGCFMKIKVGQNGEFLLDLPNKKVDVDKDLLSSNKEKIVATFDANGYELVFGIEA